MVLESPLWIIQPQQQQQGRRAVDSREGSVTTHAGFAFLNPHYSLSSQSTNHSTVNIPPIPPPPPGQYPPPPPRTLKSIFHSLCFFLIFPKSTWMNLAMFSLEPIVIQRFIRSYDQPDPLVSMVMKKRGNTSPILKVGAPKWWTKEIRRARSKRAGNM